MNTFPGEILVRSLQQLKESSRKTLTYGVEEVSEEISGMYYCSVEGCQGKYAHKSSLNKQGKINHLGRKERRTCQSLPCPICEKTYARKYHMQRHMKINHPDDK